jgi:hypothetical protein
MAAQSRTAALARVACFPLKLEVPETKTIGHVNRLDQVCACA